MQLRDAASIRFGMPNLIVVVLGVLLAGCSQPARPPDASSDLSPTPENRFEFAMRRLEFSLENASSAPGSGVSSLRTCKWKLQEPTQDEPNYTAVVTIKTRIGLAAGEAGAKPQPVAGDESEQAAANALADAAEAAATTSSEDYHLVYRDDRWELVDPPIDELPMLEADFFRHALSDG